MHENDHDVNHGNKKENNGNVTQTPLAGRSSVAWNTVDSVRRLFSQVFQTFNEVIFFPTGISARTGSK